MLCLVKREGLTSLHFFLKPLG